MKQVRLKLIGDHSWYTRRLQTDSPLGWTQQVLVLLAGGPFACEQKTWGTVFVVPSAVSWYVIEEVTD